MGPVGQVRSKTESKRKRQNETKRHKQTYREQQTDQTLPKPGAAKPGEKKLSHAQIEMYKQTERQKEGQKERQKDGDFAKKLYSW